MRCLRGISIYKRIATMREGCQHELHAVEVVRRVGEIAVEVCAADPFRFGSHADAIRAEDGADGMRAMADLIMRRGHVVPWVVPVVIIAVVIASILFCD